MENVGLLDMIFFANARVRGPGAEAFLDGLVMARVIGESPLTRRTCACASDTKGSKTLPEVRCADSILHMA